MNCIVCMASVPDTASVIKVGGDGKGIDDSGIKWIVSPYDEYALEEALQITEAKGGEVTVVTYGPDHAEAALRDCLVTAPWTVVEGNDKRYARIKVLKTLVEGLSQDLDFDPIDELPSLRALKKDRKKKPSKKSSSEDVKGGDEVALPMIQAFEFEKIVIDGKEFKFDVMIYPNGQIKKWKRKDEHDLRSGDVKKILKQNPKLLIFGLGTVGNLTVSPTVYEELEKAGIDVLAFKTDKAIETYKAQREEEGTAALFHLGD